MDLYHDPKQKTEKVLNKKSLLTVTVSKPFLNCPHGAPNPKIFCNLKFIFASVRKTLWLFFPSANKSCCFIKLVKNQASFVHNRVRRGVGLPLSWHHNLPCMDVYKELMWCKSVCDVKSGIDPLPFWLSCKQKNFCTGGEECFILLKNSKKYRSPIHHNFRYTFKNWLLMF